MLIVYHVTDCLNIPHISIQLILTASLGGRDYYYSHFMSKKNDTCHINLPMISSVRKWGNRISNLGNLTTGLMLLNFMCHSPFITIPLKKNKKQDY